jgi:lysyl oxidase
MSPRPPARRCGRRRGGRSLGLLAALALVVPGLGPAPGPALASASAAAPQSPVTLWAPARVVAVAFGHRVFTDLGLRVIAQGAPFELWSTRSAYDEPIRTVWRTPSGDVALPAGTMTTFGALRRFVRLTITSPGASVTARRSACLASWSERVRPDAAATSPYPRGCWYNPYSLGSVQGVQEGWAAPILDQAGPLRLDPGSYTVTATIARSYADVLGIAPADATRTIRLVVRTESSERTARPSAPSTAEPAAREPAHRSAGRVAGPVPDLRSLPAWGIRVAPDGDHLQFSATVWNGGDSPLVVDGFRREGEDEMDAYQYFFDGDGNQTGYQQVGHLHWDPKPTHRHWHFEDFARYTLLRADRSEAVRSHKEAFCLANTDAVDLTVPEATWNPDNTDLATSCGGLSSLSIREVLASGWGDTYAQFRAGQSFDLRGLPNGKYFVAVIANPANRLVETSGANNVSLRKLFVGGRAGHRTVRVPQVGTIVEPDVSGE